MARKKAEPPRPIDREKLLAFLTKADVGRHPYDGVGKLVVASVYAGLADRVRSGEFDDERDLVEKPF